MASQSDRSDYCIVTAEGNELRHDKKRKKSRGNREDGHDARKHRKRERERTVAKKSTKKDSKHSAKKSSKEKRKKRRGSRSRSEEEFDRGPDPERVARRLAAVMRDAVAGKADSLGRSVLRLVEAAAGDQQAVDYLDSRGWSALHHACNHNDTACVQILLSAGADAALLDPLGNTPAHLAARHGNFELLEELLYAQRPADLDRPNSQGYSAREIAVEALEALHLRSEMAVPLADAARKARQEQEWRDRMHDEMQDDWWGEGGPGMAEADEAAGGGGGFYGSASLRRHGEEEEEEWRANIVRGMRERQKARQHGSAAPEGRQHPQGTKQQGPQRPSSREGQEEAQKNWRKILEEEVEKDRQWRQKVLRGGSDSELRAKYEASWQDFLLRERPPGSVVYADVPWISPPSDSGGHQRILQVALAGIGPSDAAGRRKRIRMELMRWHPDKFTARFSKTIKPSELEAVLTGVTQTSAALTEADV